MRKLTMILLVLAAGCDRSGGEGQREGEVPPPDALANLAAEPAAPDAAALQQMVSRAMPDQVAAGAEFRNLRAGSGGSACGEVATKAGEGPAGTFRPFVVTPQGMAVIGATPQIAFQDPGDPLVDAYIRWCATPQELQEIAPLLRRGAAIPTPPPEPDAPVPLPSPGDLPPVQTAPETEAAPPPPPAPSRPAPPPQIDSFFNSVQRKGQ